LMHTFSRTLLISPYHHSCTCVNRSSSVLFFNSIIHRLGQNLKAVLIPGGVFFWGDPRPKTLQFSPHGCQIVTVNLFSAGKMNYKYTMQIYAEKAPKYVWRLGSPCPDPQGELMRSPRARTPSRNGRPTSKGRERRGGGLFLRGTEGREGEFPQSQGENNKHCLKVITFCSCLYLITIITRSAW